MLINILKQKGGWGWNYSYLASIKIKMLMPNLWDPWKGVFRRNSLKTFFTIEGNFKIQVRIHLKTLEENNNKINQKNLRKGNELR